jgi:hypothetical protein
MIVVVERMMVEEVKGVVVVGLYEYKEYKDCGLRSIRRTISLLRW